jgi:protein-S-isoprenylcysteine O-methyltransferase Ste14
MKMDNYFYLILYVISAVCLWILLSAILFNFYFSRTKATKKIKKSVVETGSMLLFFVLMVLIVYNKIGVLSVDHGWRILLASCGTVQIIAGTAINIYGRLSLKQNWGNQIRIYENHSLVRTGAYRYIRHPLYTSTILMIYGFSFLFINPLVFFLNTMVFIPSMVYRARQEEVILIQFFKEEYENYQSKTGMLFPKIRKKKVKE